jgi:hypothetical protein
MSGPAEREPMPVRTGDPSQVEVFPFIHKDLLVREAYGREEYGGPLVTNDGRDNDWDAYQEALDLAVYLRKGILERKPLKEEIARLRTKVSDQDAKIADLTRKLAQSENNVRLLQEKDADLKRKLAQLALFADAVSREQQGHSGPA